MDKSDFESLKRGLAQVEAYKAGKEGFVTHASTADFQHEALHAAHMINVMFEQFIADHPFVEAHPDLASEAAKIGEALGDLYQRIGAKEVGGEPQPGTT